MGILHINKIKITKTWCVSFLKLLSMNLDKICCWNKLLVKLIENPIYAVTVHMQKQRNLFFRANLYFIYKYFFECMIHRILNASSLVKHFFQALAFVKLRIALHVCEKSSHIFVNLKNIYMVMRLLFIHI